MPRHYTPRLAQTCPVCGRVFLVPPSQLRDRIACSMACSALRRRVPPQERFWDKVDKHGPVPAHQPQLGRCWIWTGVRRQKKGGPSYGVLRLSEPPHRQIGAHRLSFLMAGGVLSEANPDVLHLCDNPSCVNPAHLMAGNPQENSRQMVERGRAGWRRPGELNANAKLTAEDVRVSRRCYAKGGVTHKELAHVFGISASQTQAILRGLAWTGIE